MMVFLVIILDCSVEVMVNGFMVELGLIRLVIVWLWCVFGVVLLIELGL